MALYSLWSNWTTVFLVEERGLPPEAANLTLAWVPPVFANLGGLFGGWLALRWIGGGADVLAARRRVCRWSAAALLATAAVPFTSSAGTATALISWSFFWVTAMSVNVYAMPLDLFGAGRAAFAVSALTCAYGAMQTVFSPGAGALIDRHGFGPVCLGGALLPLGAAVLLHWRETRAPLPGGRGVTGAEERESPLADRARRPFTVRDARREDLPAIARIQGASPEAAQWDPAGYLAYECRVAERNGEVGGFIVVRPVAPGESEILNLAVAPALRRTGIAETLARDAIAERPGNLFLEVRESNHAARALYRKLGFAECGRRGEYYADPPDAAIVMRFQPC
jgi:ribosomal protein S18 acetylase RimI-like enzyme